MEKFIRPFPKILRIEPASSCNFRCVHCPTGLDLNESLGIMSTETFNQIFEQIKHHKFDVIVLYHGGEPILNKQFFEMAKKLKPITKRLRTTTNGSLLDDKVIEKFLDLEFDEIDISLDGESPEENDLIRIGGNYHEITKQVIKLIRLRNERNQTVPRITIANAQVPSDANTDTIASIPKYLTDTFEEVIDDVKFSPFYTIQWPGMPEKIDITEKPKGNFCDHIVNTISIRWNGDIVPCCYDLINMMVMGNMLQDNIEHIWNNEKYIKFRKDVDEFNPPDLCKNCFVLQGFKRARTNTFKILK